MSSVLRERTAPEPASPPELSLVPGPDRLRRPGLVLAAVYVLAVAYHWFQSRAHVTPAVFPDELLYSKLAQALGSGDGFTIRGEQVFFPAPMAALAQVPAWLIHSMPAAYAVAKALNAAVMAAAVFPAYSLARRLVRPSFALVAAGLSVAGPQMLYSAYMTSEALAYTVFLLALATMLRAIERPSRRMEAAVLAVSAAAVLTRIQFAVLPLAYLCAAPLAGRTCGEPFRVVLRRHRLSLCGLVVLGAVPLLSGGILLGTYRGAPSLDFDPVAVLSWTARTAALLPFAAGWLIVPGALLGLAFLVARPRGHAEAGFAVLAFVVSVLVLLEAGLVAAGEAVRPLERYSIYLVPLVAISFFAYAERGAPWRRAYAVLAVAGAATAWLMPFPAEAGTGFTFDTPTFSAYGQLAHWVGHPNAATVFAGVPFLGGIALALVPLRRRLVPVAVGLATTAALLASGLPAYAGDHAVTRGTLALRAGDPPDWLDRSGLGPADYLQLPGGSAHFGWLLESWNRSFRKAIVLEAPAYDGFATSRARIDSDGRLLVGGRELDAGVIVANDLGTAIDIDGRVVARPRLGLTAYRVPASPHVRSLATGLYFDRWASALLRYRAWPRLPHSRGFYRLVLGLPGGFEARDVSIAAGSVRRTVSIGPGETKALSIPVSGSPPAPLEVRANRADFLAAGTADARLVGVRVLAISYGTKRVP